MIFCICEIGWGVKLDDFHIHSARISALSPQLAAFYGLLTVDERERAARYKVEPARVQFISGRGWLRQKLAAYTGIAPDDLRFSYGARGKPALLNAAGVHFNLAHAGDVLLLGVTRHREIGVDVEPVRTLPHLHRMAADNFSAGERVALFALPEAEQVGAFLRIWTRKEAYIKAVGTGFALPLADFDVSYDDPPQLSRAGNGWALHHLEPEPGYVGAVCVQRV